HLAAAVGVKLIVESPVRTIETNVHGTEVVLAQACKKRKKVLVASTSEVYGLSTQVPFREDGSLVLGPTNKVRWSYACSKAIGELAEMVKSQSDSRSEIVLVSYDKAYEEGFEDMPRRVPDTTKIRNLLGWQPTLSLEEILRRVIAHEQEGEHEPAKTAAVSAA